MQTAHVIDYSDPACRDGAKGCQAEIVAFVRGIKRPRENPVTAKQICKWLRVTPDDFVQDQITECVAANRIRAVSRSLSSSRRFNGVCVYEPTAT